MLSAKARISSGGTGGATKLLDGDNSSPQNGTGLQKAHGTALVRIKLGSVGDSPYPVFSGTRNGVLSKTADASEYGCQ